MNESVLGTTLRVEFAVNLKRVRHVELVTKDQEIKKEPPLRRSLILAHQINNLFKTGKARSFTHLAKWLHMTHGRVSQLMNLLLLAPQIQEEIIMGSQPTCARLTERHIRPIPMEADWQKQRDLWREVLAGQTPALGPSSPELLRHT